MMICIPSPFYFYPWLYVLNMDHDLDLKRRQTITNIVDYPKNSENNHHKNLNSLARGRQAPLSFTYMGEGYSIALHR
jgi:hypothetical protein